MANRIVEMSTKILVAAGAINWGLLKFVNINLVDKFGSLSNLVYALIGVAGVYYAWLLYDKKA